MCIPPSAYSAAMPAPSCLLKLSTYAEPIFSSSCLMSIMSSPKNGCAHRLHGHQCGGESLVENLVGRSATRCAALAIVPSSPSGPQTVVALHSLVEKSRDMIWGGRISAAKIDAYARNTCRKSNINLPT